MLKAKRLLLLSMIVLIAVPAMAQVTVTERFEANASFPGGGYYVMSVTNNSTDPVYVIAIGSNSAQVSSVGFDFAGTWYTFPSSRSEWEANEAIAQSFPGYTAPDTSTLDWNTYIGAGFAGVVPYQMQVDGNALAPGETREGLNYNVIGARGASSMEEELSFVCFGAVGEVVDQGFVIFVPDAVPVTSRGMSRVKSLFR